MIRYNIFILILLEIDSHIFSDDPHTADIMDIKYDI